jgi:hypothetical protein
MALELDEEQVLYFRARRGHLVGPGAKSPRAAAQALVGAQSQQLAPSLLALSLRTEGRPSAHALETALFESPRTLVRTRGQRDTLFLFDPERDWADVIAAGAERGSGSRGGELPPNATVAKALTTLVDAGAPRCRSHVAGLVPARYLREIAAYMRKVTRQETTDGVVMRVAAGRLFWVLAHRGQVSLARKAGTEQSYAARSLWFPTLAWPPMPDPRAAAVRLADRYLSTYGPATAADLAHFFGARVTAARGWLGDIEAKGDLVRVECGGRSGLVARRQDRAELKKRPPEGARAWPVRLLPLWDSMLMAHADKRWAVPDRTEETRIWRTGGHVAATVHSRGRIVATWRQTQTAGRLLIRVEPLAGWRTARHAAGVRREARAVARHLGLEAVDVTVEG